MPTSANQHILCSVNDVFKRIRPTDLDSAIIRQLPADTTQPEVPVDPLGKVTRPFDGAPARKRCEFSSFGQLRMNALDCVVYLVPLAVLQIPRTSPSTFPADQLPRSMVVNRAWHTTFRNGCGPRPDSRAISTTIPRSSYGASWRTLISESGSRYPYRSENCSAMPVSSSPTVPVCCTQRTSVQLSRLRKSDTTTEGSRTPRTLALVPRHRRRRATGSGCSAVAFGGTPNAGLALADGGARDYRIGWRLTSGRPRRRGQPRRHQAQGCGRHRHLGVCRI